MEEQKSSFSGVPTFEGEAQGCDSPPQPHPVPQRCRACLG